MLRGVLWCTMCGQSLMQERWDVGLCSQCRYSCHYQAAAW
jgi:Zn finger protein HypA/HybF involved in hydrogenase expression